MDQKTNTSLANAKELVIQILSGGRKKALFATELLAGLRRYDLTKDNIDQALIELEADSIVVLRDHFCADPHLAKVDLRVIGLIDDALGDQSHVAALREIDLTWNKWLGEYLSNHRCG